MGADAPLLAPELAERLKQLLVEFGGAHIDPQTVAHAFRKKGLALIDPDRQRALIDERVYEGALWRGHRWQRLAEAYQRSRLPDADTWRFISGGLE
jgi:hypothetical protein